MCRRPTECERDLIMSQRYVYSLAIAASLALPLAGSASAGILGVPFGAADASIRMAPIENAQFFFGGHNFCWYDDGWEGPGWYWCGYAYRNGLGWGGGEGWRGWRRGGAGMGAGGQHGSNVGHGTGGAPQTGPAPGGVVHRPGGAQGSHGGGNGGGNFGGQGAHGGGNGGGQAAPPHGGGNGGGQGAPHGGGSGGQEFPPK